MKKGALIVFSGLPGAGKTTCARTIDAAAVHVSRDNIRTALVGLSCEWTLSLALVALARSLLHAGKSVVVDAPNLDPLDHALWRGLAAETGAELDWRHIGTPLAECIRRDAQRPEAIGEADVRAMAERYGAT